LKIDFRAPWREIPRKRNPSNYKNKFLKNIHAENPKRQYCHLWLFVQAAKTAENIHSAMKETITESHIHLLVSKNLKRLRSVQNISQLNLALKAGITHNFINDIENGKKGVSAKTIAKLCTALRVEPYQFFLPDNMSNNKMRVYLNDFNDSLQKIVRELEDYYIPGD
jgi:transcriptional regulator with XRE-family HTH domain